MSWWLDGRSLYDFHYHATHFGFTYPPFAALVLSPFGALPVVGAIALITTLSVGAILFTTYEVVAPVTRRHGRPVLFSVALAVLLFSAMEPVRETLSYGQINLVLAALVLADVVALRRGWRWAGVGIGLATAVKLTPGLFVVYLLLTRRRGPAAVAAGTFVGTGLLAMAAAPGESLRYWGAELWQTSRVGTPTDTENQSLLGLLARLAHPAQPSTALWLLLGAAVLVVGLRRAVQAAAAGDELAGITITGLTSCLLSPISWTHHIYWVVPAVVVLLDVAAGTPSEGRWNGRRATAAAAAAAVYVVFAVSLIWAFGPTPRDGTVPGLAGALGASADVFVLLALLVALPVRRLTPAAPSATRTTAPPRPAGSSPR